QAALRAKEHRARGRAVEEGRANHGHGRRGQYGPRCERAARPTRCPAATESTSRVRDRDPFLPGSSACTHRSNVRAASAVETMAETRAGDRSGAYPLAKAARPEGDRKSARRDGPVITANGA